jgi:hypothetical protein
MALGCSNATVRVSGGQASDSGASSSSGGGESGVGSDYGGDAGTGAGGDGSPPVTSSCFDSHPMQYPADVLLPPSAQADLDSTTAAAYDQWKSKYVMQGCGGYYVLAGGGTGQDVGDVVSEGQGYGMVITALMACHDPDAKTTFDGMYAFFKEFPSATHKNLMAWTVQAGS